MVDTLLVFHAMATVDTLVRTLHLMTAGVWAGWTVFMAALVIPAAREGRLGADGLSWMTGRFSLFSKVAPVVMFLTGMYMLGQGYSGDALLTSTRGNLVVTMVGLWIVLSAVTNVASRRLTTGVEVGGVEQATSGVMMMFSVAGVAALGLLFVGGWL